MRRERHSFDENKPENPRKEANWLSVLTFWYTIKVFKLGKKRDLNESDLTKPLAEHESAYLGNKIAKLWSDEVDRAKSNGELPSMNRVLLKCFFAENLLYGIILAVMEIGVKMSQPILLGLLIRYFDPKNKLNDRPKKFPRYLWRLFYYWTPDQCAITKDEAYLYAGGILFCSLIAVIVLHPYMMAVMHIGMKIRVACCSLIYRKALRISLGALAGRTIGNIVNLMSNDVNRFDIAPIFFHYLWISPVQVIFILYLMYSEMSMSAVWGIMAILAFIPLQVLLGARTTTLRRNTAKCTDDRVRLMNEIIQGVQVIKMYAWEYAFADLINKSRMNEISVIRHTTYVKGIIMSFIMFTTRFAIFLTVVTYVLTGKNITSENVFVVTAFYQILRVTMTVYFPQGVAQAAEANVALSRIRLFMLTEETDIGDPTPLYPNWMDKTNKTKYRRAQDLIFKKKRPTSIRIHIVKAWAKYGDKICLEDINLEITPGNLVAFIGPVASGKTCILNMILGELAPYKGLVEVNGIVSYASQEPWLFAGSIRANILFGQIYDKERYREVVKVCALVRDFTLLPYGDLTIVGERGISLSGGQRARVNLARAVYKKADIYLFDDPLSAVDPHVGRHLFDECIKDYLKDKITILITHQLQHLTNVHQLILMQDGKIQASGTYEHLAQSGLNFASVLGEQHFVNEDEEAKRQAIKMKAYSIHSRSTTVPVFGEEEEEEEPEEIAEMRTTGAVEGYVYKEYFRSGGNCCIMFILIMMFLGAQCFASGGDFVVSKWVHVEEFRNDNGTRKSPGVWNNLSRQTFISIYGGFIAVTAIVAVSRSFAFFTVCMRSSIKLHNRMFHSVSRAVMRFFNTNTSGRILNRFSKDLGAVDEFLPNAMIDTAQITLNLLGVVVVVTIVDAILLIPTMIACILFYLVRQFYLHTSRSVKRLEGITRSPTFSHLNATLQGLTTIRSHGQEIILVDEFDRYQDVHSSAWFLFIATSRAFGYWLDGICAIYIGIITFYFLVVSNRAHGSEIGLAITQCIGLSGLFQWGMRQSAELENQMTSVERVLEFTQLEQEAALESAPGLQPDPEWPQYGRIQLTNAQMTYCELEAPVLKDISLIIEPQEKIGIVGRTGAGKSSLIAMLFRLAYVEGEIIIDNINIAQIGLHDLRKKISIIPQEPVLFSGTLRYNLDPFQEYHDSVLLTALTIVELKPAVNEGMACLDQVMSDSGCNMSVGQRQLICLARALIRNNCILIMDEATANVDPQTDKFIQTTIRSQFAHCTVLTIAHRLHTVMDCDKILVMDAGTMVEFDHPHLLLKNKTGFLTDMVNKTGSSMAETLKHIAQESFKEKMATAKTSSANRQGVT